MTGFLKRNLEASKRLKAKLAAGEVTTLINSMHPSASLVERLGSYGFDAVLIDAEHGSVSRDRVEDMSRAAALSGIAAIIRPEGSVQHLITGYLGCAVDGLMLPIIRSAAQARELAGWFRFSAPKDHIHRTLILMIEHIDAVNDLPALLDIEGVDAYMIAPADLALSLGEDLTQGPPSQRVVEIMDQTVRNIVKSGRACGMRVDFDTVDKYVDMGVRMLYLHTDHMIAYGAKEYFARVAAATKRRKA